MKVVIRNSNYSYELLKHSFFEIMDAIGGEMIRKDHTVLIKPNLLLPAMPQRAILTHPSVIRAAVEYVLAKGAKAIISDSPAMGSFEKILQENGITEAIRDLDAQCRIFQDSLKVDIGKPFDFIEMAYQAVNADVIINLPKLKTHSQMLLTLGVKNMFGCIIGNRKAEWHMRTGINKEMFAKLLVMIYQRLKPTFTVLDGILALEGEGPGKRGVPKEIGVLIGSEDAYAVDTAVCQMLGMAPKQLPTLKIAAEMGLIGKTMEIDGRLPSIRDFKLPEMVSPMFGPKQTHSFLRRHFLQRPIVDIPVCKMCGKCWDICPADAVSHGRESLRFNYDLCIRCYCCIEVCPHGALHTEETFPGRIMRRIFLPKS